MTKFTAFLDTIALVNQLQRRQDIQWLFYCGMLFGSPEKWWDDFGTRTSAHEGVDIVFYTNPLNHTGRLDANTKIPSMENGTILNICDDLLGKAIVIENESNEDQSSTTLMVYSHLNPENNITTGHQIKKGEVLAQIADTAKKNAKLAPHLHLSCVELQRGVKPDDLNWDLFQDIQKINLINPVFL